MSGNLVECTSVTVVPEYTVYRLCIPAIPDRWHSSASGVSLLENPAANDLDTGSMRSSYFQCVIGSQRLLYVEAFPTSRDGP
jgi:hypothetical protein